MAQHSKGAVPTKRIAGFTLIEVVIVVSLMAFILAMVIGPFGSYMKRQQILTEVNEYDRNLHEQKTRAQAAEADTAHGVAISSTTLTLFTGTTYTAGAADNRVFSLSRIRATSTLAGDVTDFYFDKRTGEPSTTGTIELYPVDPSVEVSTTTFTIYASGLIEQTQD